MLDGEDDSDFTEDAPDLELDDPEEDAPEEQGGEDEAPADDEGDDDIVSFAGVEARSEDEPEHIRELRQRYREKDKENRELKARLAPKDEDVGPKPTLDDPDIEWDADKFEAKLSAWNARKSAADNRARAQQEQAEAAQRELQAEVATYAQQKQSLKVRDFDAAEERVTSKLDDAKQVLLIKVANNKAALLYALGKNPEKLDQIAGIADLAKFGAAVVRLDMETQVSKRKPTTAPIERRTGSGPIANGTGSLDKLYAEAAKTGDLSKAAAYMAAQARKGKN